VQYRLADAGARIELENAGERVAPALKDGRIKAVPMYVRDGRRLVLTGLYELVALAISKHGDASSVVPFMLQVLRQSVRADTVDFSMHPALHVMELMAHEGWVTCRKEQGEAALNVSVPREGELIYTSQSRQREQSSS
jgi:hypothetical protein